MATLGVKYMAYNAKKEKEVYNTLLKMGYNLGFCEIISKQMCTDWTATRMLGYLNQGGSLREEDIVDEMLGILSDRDSIIQKKEMEYYQNKINEIYNRGLSEE